jgi:2-oxoglutarate dehydrogenase E1 component
MSDLNDFYGPNAGYVVELYERFRQDPASVDEPTRRIFERWASEGGPAAVLPSSPPPSAPSVPPEAPTVRYADGIEIAKVVGAARLIRLIRETGHLCAAIDPLGSPPPGNPDIDLTAQGLTEEDLERMPAEVLRSPLSEGATNALESIERLRNAYTGSIGYEDDHIQINEERAWLRDAAETGRFFQGIDDHYKRVLLERLTQVVSFEFFLHRAFVGQKWFSLAGTDMLIPMLDLIIHDAAAAGTREVVMGMAHRGRLNVLAHVLGQPYNSIFAEFSSGDDPKSAVSELPSTGWTGDVKYHLGAYLNYQEQGLPTMPITLAPNPSHLEYVNPVVLGRTRAAQEKTDQPGKPVQNTKAAGAILIHGDAAFPGQGIVAETLNLSQLAGYAVGGTLHIILNNQIGFTTSPADDRSTLYASDLAKGFEIPIVHVNADDPIACIAAARMAYAYCAKFSRDFLIDLVGYRRWGHNEGDEPSFTQPRMYEMISKHPTVRDLWAQRLIEEGVVTEDEAKEMAEKAEKTFQDAKNNPPPSAHADEDFGLVAPQCPLPVATGVPEERLLALNEQLLIRPEGFNVISKLERSLQRRRESIRQPGGIDWAHAEALAFASILADGTPIRMTGQDTERGTFSQRHAVLRDPNTSREFTPLQNLPDARASFAVYNSPLSENAVLGFEYGYSMHARGTLVLWEAQYGDFANSAQVIIDQFITSGNAKWGQTPSLVMLLPHGLEGAGPEHSSARLERFIQLTTQDNIRIVNCTSSAQYFHVLRRQAALLGFDPRPLVIMSPKSLLRHPRAASSLEDLTAGRFQPALEDPRSLQRAEEVTRLIFCTGKVYIDLVTNPGWAEADRVGVIRIEEIYPYPERELQIAISRFPNVQELVWLQEEPRNMGGWVFFRSRLPLLIGLRSGEIAYCGRPESASPAEGSLRQHNAEQARIIYEAMQGAPELSRRKEKVRNAR